MIKLSKMADHALTLCSQLARFPEQTKSAAEWARLSSLREPTAAKILKMLCCAEICQSERGKAGGYRMSSSHSAFTALHVVEAVDGPLSFTDCGEGGKGCAKSGDCPVEPHVGKVAQAIRDGLRQIALLDLAKEDSHVQ